MSTQSISATAAAAAKISKPKKTKNISHAKQEQQPLVLPEHALPEFGMMSIEQIIVKNQARTEFNQNRLDELAKDIARRGIKTPLQVRKTDRGFELTAGERRLRAARLAKLEQVPVLIFCIDDREHKLAQLAENIQREDLSICDEARAIAEIYAELKSVKAVAELLDKSIAWVSKRVSATNNLGTYASALLADGITEDLELVLAVDKLDRETPGTNSAWALCEKIRAGKAGRTEAREALKMAKTRKEITGQSSAEQVQTRPEKAHPADRLWEQYRGEWLAIHEVGQMYAIAQRLPDAPRYGPEMQEWKNALLEVRAQETKLREAEKKRRDIELHRMNFIIKFHKIEDFRAAYDQWQKEGGKTPEIAQEAKQ